MRFPRKVYAIQHNITKKIYIGSSCNVESRYMNHIYSLRNGKHRVEDMQKDFDEYGENYSLFVLDEINNFEERTKEYDWMKKYNTYDRDTGYNYSDRTKKILQINTEIPYREGCPLPKVAN